MLKLQGKIAVVIGGGSWLGRAVAIKLAALGAIVFIAGPTLAKLTETVEQITSSGGSSTCTVLDVRNEQHVMDFFTEIDKRHQQLDIVVNCAAIYPCSLIDQLSVKEWQAVIDTNLTGSFILLKYAAKLMKKKHSGKIIFLASIAGEKIGVPGLAHYGASKAGVNGLMRAAALELAPYGINVNSISPGNFLNKERFNVDEDVFQVMKKSIPLGRTGQPEELAQFVAFLASDEASFITGQDYVIDGGEIIQ